MGNQKATPLRGKPENSLAELSAHSPQPHERQRLGSRTAYHSAIIGAAVTTCICVTVLIESGALGAQRVDANVTKPGSSEAEWATGKALTQTLLGQTSVSWTDAPFAERLRAFAASKRIAVFIDRRLDPGVKINLQQANATIEQLFLDVAEQHGLAGMCRVDDLIYFGPLETVQALPIVWNDLPRISNRPASRLSWTPLSKPANVLQALAQSSGIKITNIERVHHDLWPAVSVPPLTPTKQVALISVGYGSWPVLDEYRTNALKFENWNPPSRGTIQYRRSANDRVRNSELRRLLRKEFAGIKFSVSDKLVKMTGDTDQMYAAKAFLVRRNKFSPPPSRDIRFTLKTSATRFQLLKTIAKQTGRKLTYDASIKRSLDQQITIECQQVDLERLIEKTLDGSVLAFELTKSEIKLFRR